MMFLSFDRELHFTLLYVISKPFAKHLSSSYGWLWNWRERMLLHRLNSMKNYVRSNPQFYNDNF